MKTILYTFIILLSSEILVAQWTWLNPTPQGNYLKQVIMLNNGNVISAGNCGTIMFSSDSGNSWIVSHRINDTAASINSLFKLNDNLIFAGSNDSKIFRSTNGGLNWVQISRISLMPSFQIKLFFTDSQSGFAYYQNAFYKTTNGGFNWSFASQYLQPVGDYWFVDANTGFTAGGAITDGLPVTWSYKTTNGGFNWVQMNVPEMGPVTKVQFLNANTGYLAGFSDIFKTTNAGVNWFVINPMGTFSRINYFYFFNESTAYVGTDNSNFFKTTNGGANWSGVLIPHYTFNSYFGINNFSFTDLQNGVALLHDHIIVTTTNSGNNWTLNTNSLNHYTPFKAIEFIDNNTAILGGWGSTSDHIFYKSTNSGVSWEGKYLYNYQNSTGYIYDVEFPSFSTGYAVGGGNNKGYVYKSINSGNNWTKMDSIGNASANECFFVDDNTGFVIGRFTQIYKTTNGAVSWTAFPTSSTNGFNSIYFIDYNTGYVCSGNANPQLIYKTTNNGTNWIQIYSMTGSSFNDIYFVNSSTGYLAARGILKSTDGGNTWLQKSPNYYDYFYGIRFSSQNTGYAFGVYGKMIKTTDAGETWGELPMPTDLMGSDMHFINENTGYFVGDQGMILKTTNGGGNVINGINDPVFEIPGDYRLSQNFPNPFNPVTTINFSIPKYSQIRISIYDILGKEIDVIVNGYLSPGNYNIEWNAQNFASGVYFYELKTGEFIERRKMVLIK